MQKRCATNPGELQMLWISWWFPSWIRVVSLAASKTRLPGLCCKTPNDVQQHLAWGIRRWLHKTVSLCGFEPKLRFQPGRISSFDPLGKVIPLKRIGRLAESYGMPWPRQPHSCPRFSSLWVEVPQKQRPSVLSLQSHKCQMRIVLRQQKGLAGLS